ncbi:MAG: hypothetical protein SFV19_09410 [Rhodospirillaceae bacterium]|nr:hypothetical protein [Rhodospirillaceae bacterium]
MILAQAVEDLSLQSGLAVIETLRKCFFIASLTIAGALFVASHEPQTRHEAGAARAIEASLAADRR